MKKGNIELTEFKNYPGNYTIKGRYHGEYLSVHAQDLKDLKSLIDTVLGEEEVEFPLNSVAGIPIGGDVIVKLEDGRIIEGTIKAQPLTEGEGKKCPYRNEECPRCYPKPQESNKKEGKEEIPF